MQDHIVEGEHGGVLQGVLSCASFRRAAASGQKVSPFSRYTSTMFLPRKEVLPRSSFSLFVQL